MPGPKAPAANLSKAEREGLSKLIKRHQAGQHKSRYAPELYWQRQTGRAIKRLRLDIK